MFWAIVADETTDRHRREQLAVVIRYVLCESGTWCCYEDPVAIIDIYADIKAADDSDSEVRLSGQAIGDALLRIVTEIGLVLANCWPTARYQVITLEQHSGSDRTQ